MNPLLKNLNKNDFCFKIINNIKPLSNQLFDKAKTKIDTKTKPLGALGRLEELAIQLSLIQNTLKPEIKQKNLFVFASDHGVVNQGVSAYPSEVTAQMVDNFLNKGAAINVFCRHHNINMKVIDIGVKQDFNPHPDLIIKKVGKGTKNFVNKNAMTKEQMLLAIKNGIEIFLDAYNEKPIDIVGLGEMGIGNTTSATAIICAITGINPAKIAGRGTGIDNKGLKHKIKIIKKALDFHAPNSLDGFEILQKIGGFEIAGIAGAVLASAFKKCPVVLDGVISSAAGMLAYLINPYVKGYLIAGHRSVEKAHTATLDFLKLSPLIDFNMRLGEGTGAAIAIDMADLSCKIMTQMASFEKAKVSQSSIKI